MKLKNILLYSVASLLLAGCSKSNTSKMDIFIDQLMDEMTVKEKIGQLNLNVSGGFVQEKVSMATLFHWSNE